MSKKAKNLPLNIIKFKLKQYLTLRPYNVYYIKIYHMKTLLAYAWQATKQSPENSLWLIVVLVVALADNCEALRQQCINVFE
jgi:hypothetical protein